MFQTNPRLTHFPRLHFHSILLSEHVYLTQAWPDNHRWYKNILSILKLAIAVSKYSAFEFIFHSQPYPEADGPTNHGLLYHSVAF